MMSLDATAPILVVESDRQLGQAIVEQLIADGFNVELARSAEHARMLANASAPKLAVLGWLDSPSGALELLREIRQPGRPGTPWDGALPAIMMGAEHGSWTCCERSKQELMTSLPGPPPTPSCALACGRSCAAPAFPRSGD